MLPRPAQSRVTDAARAHWRSVRYRVWAAVLVAAAGAMCFVPLFDVLGFGFSFAIAIVAGLAACDLGAAFARRVRGIPMRPVADAIGPGRTLWRVAASAIPAHLGLLVPPLVVIATNALRVRNCDWLFGALAYLALPGVTVVLCTALGAVAGVAIGDRRRLSNAAPYALFVASAGWSIWRFYASPPVFVYNLFGGYFPGNLYDEQLALGAPLVWSRLFQASAIATLAAIVWTVLDVPRLAPAAPARCKPHGLRVRAWTAAALAATVATALWIDSGALGFDIDASDIAHHLRGRRDTEHFTIYYPTGGDIERDIDAIADDHEFRYAQVVRALGAEARGRITSFYFANADDKHRMMGARHVYMAKPWRREIYLNHERPPHSVLRHEIAHVVAGAFGDPVFRTSAGTVLGLPLFFNVGMIEGIAVAADWPDKYTRPLTPHQSVKAMRELGLLPPIERVFSTGFLAFSSAKSYTVAGSFVRFLLDRYGADAVRALYANGGDVHAVFGRPERELVAEWSAMIDAVELPPRAAEVVRERFRRPSIFHRPCPHAIARLGGLATEALRDGEPERAVSLWRRVCRAVPEEPTYRLRLADLLRIAARDDDAEAIYHAIAADAEHISSVLRAEALLGLAGIAARRDRTGAGVAGAGYAGQPGRDIDPAGRREAIAYLERAAALPLPDDDARVVEAYLFAARHDGPAGPALRAYFWGYQPRFGADPLVQIGQATRAIALEPALGLGYYVLGHNLRGRGTPAMTVWAITAALDHRLPGPRLERQAARYLGEAGYLAGDDRAVERASEILVRPDQPVSARLHGLDFRERLQWRRTGRLPASAPALP